MGKELPNGWSESTIQEVVEILDNMRVPVSASERAKRIGDVPYYGATGQAGWIDDYLFDEELVLLGEDGAPFFDKKKNVAYLISGKSWVNNHAHVLKANNQISINKYILHFLNQFDYKDFVGGTTRLKLNQGNLKSIPVPIPPLAEQKRIVAKLDALFGHLDTLKTKLNRIPELLKNFRQQVLTQAVTGKLTEEWRRGKGLGGWENAKSSIEEFTGKKFDSYVIDNNNWLETELGSISKRVSVGHVGKTSEYYTDEESGIPFLRSQNVRPGRIDYNNLAYITKAFHDKLKKSQLEAGDLLIVRVGANRGDSTILPEGMGKINCANIVFARPFKKFSGFLDLYFQSSKWLSLLDELTTGTAQGVINTRIVEKVRVNFPPELEQFAIINRVNNLFALADKIELRYQSLKEKIGNLPQAVLNKAFKGELVPQDPNDEPASELLERIRRSHKKEVKKIVKREIQKNTLDKSKHGISISTPSKRKISTKSGIKIIEREGAELNDELTQLFFDIQDSPMYSLLISEFEDRIFDFDELLSAYRLDYKNTWNQLSDILYLSSIGMRPGLKQQFDSINNRMVFKWLNSK